MAESESARRVLVIDDEETILRTFGRYLRAEGFEVTTAQSGEEGLAEMQREPYPVVLLDLKMPELGGLEVLSRLREEYTRCEVIIVSGHGEMKEAIESLRRGANNYLQKPVDLEELSICVTRAFEKLDRAARLRAVQDQLYHVQKMEALGTLAGGVAHEFNNLMGGIIGYCDMALTQDDEALRRKALETSLKAASRASEISRNLLRFARRAESRKRPGDLNAVVRDTLNLLRTDLEAQHILVETDLAPLPEALLDIGQIQQLFLNLIVNARQSLQSVREGQRRIGVRTWRDGDWIAAEIRDNGPGIPPDRLRRVFEPFYTTQGVLSGGADTATGLGLSVAEGIARNHEGSLEAASPPGGGAVFTLRLPAPTAAPHSTSVRVMIVDDDEALRRVVGAILQQHGCEVVAVHDGAAALERADQGDIDVVLLDYAMPGMDGLAVLRELQLRRPDLPVLILTALRTPDLARSAVLGGARECIAKPVNHDKLVFLVRKYGARDDTHTPADAERDAAAVLARKPHILVAEENEIIRDVYGIVLSRAGFELTAVATLTEAAAQTEGRYYDLILLDVETPNGDGFTAIRTLRANNPFTPIIISSGEVSDDMLRQGLHAGASRVLLKPINPDGLVREVTRLLSIYRETQP